MKAKRAIVPKVAVEQIVIPVVSKEDELRQQLAETQKQLEALLPKAKTEKTKATTKKTVRKVSPEQIEKLRAAREAWFKKKGYGKYAKKSVQD